jgi:hypothetical protein
MAGQGARGRPGRSERLGTWCGLGFDLGGLTATSLARLPPLAGLGVAAARARPNDRLRLRCCWRPLRSSPRSQLLALLTIANGGAS